MSQCETAAVHVVGLASIAQKVTVILLKKQEVSFDKLKRLVLIGSNVTNFQTYCEIVVLSLIRYLGLDSSFKEEIRNDNDAYRLFNALNLEDPKVNSFFVEFIAVLAPEIFSALSTVLAQLASRLATQNKTRYTTERIQILEARINQMIQDSSIETKELEEPEEEIAQLSSKAKSQKKVRRVSFAEYMFSPGSASHRGSRLVENRKKSDKSSSGNSSRNLKIEKLRIASADSSNYNDETASQTSERLANIKKKERDVIPDADEATLPTVNEIRSKKVTFAKEADESSVDF
jgi:uncharacterized protein (UPF0305 family)